MSNRVIRFPACSVNQIDPSGVVVMPVGPKRVPFAGWNSLITPLSGLSIPILPPFDSVNQTKPFAPIVAWIGIASAVGI